MEIRNHGAEVSQVARNKPNDGGNHGQAVSEVARSHSPAQSAKAMANANVAAAMEQVSLSAGQDSLALLYRAAVEAIDEHLAPTLGDNATQRGLEQGIDYSPQATADRIVDFATQFFETYRGQNASLSFDEQLDGFMSVIGDAVDRGIDEARGILDGLQVLDGDIATNVDLTQGLVHEGLQAFRDGFYQDDAAGDSAEG
ncbi:hypothetical protein FCL40_03655 [Ferrimonas sediminicola]|uniref:DUF5610 domain-containing protein n=1 Tax=Ferrimonas sediminicola TaxID=2569538 RepID=A0A4U1BI98_9GAMM|nr:DUF5610 domain-containing protein [Ferrimonas sediminicola]TKB50269.1 hypothetical protein FCL40_03655 [Ferrimonas sediminicola]